MIKKSLIKKIAKVEQINEDIILNGIKEGKIVIPHNLKRNILNPCAIGKGVSTKVNANIGTSLDYPSLKNELKKLKVAICSGADTVMDLSTGGNLDVIRRNIIKESSVPVGTVPIYQAAIESKKKYGEIVKMDEEKIFEVIERHAESGVDFLTLHCGVNLKVLEVLKKSKRLMSIVSRGGAILACWMEKNKKENPLYEKFDRVLKIAKKYNLTLSLGDGLRPGCLYDATDKPQIAELYTLGELVKKARKEKVQVMVEGPGHIPLDQIEFNVKLEKKICKGAPFYVLGPLVTDVATGYDHIAGAIGGAVAGMYGADFLCYVTPSEHLGLPDINDVREGVIITKIAAHTADLVKGIEKAKELDNKMSFARKNFDWKKQIKLALDPKKVAKYRTIKKTKFKSVCSMCGEYCSLKMMENF